MFSIVLFAGRLGAGGAEERVDFNFQIRPLLSDRCFKCHGPDAKSRKADLRLDVLENAIALRDKKTGTRAIVPGKPEKSEVIRRITSTDPDDQMPPPDSHLKISPEEIALIRQWIKQGAEYKAHWAFNPVGKISVPKVRSSAFTRL
ncbi:MAG: c-type cytochrome domain-containing protein, partial [Verrucomicrobiota bacterium]